MSTNLFVAILSSTVLTKGTFVCDAMPFPKDLVGIPHYVGHPATKALLDALGALPAPEKLFGGLEIGQSFLAVPLANNPRDNAGMTRDIAIANASQLVAKLVTRIA